MKPFLSKKHQLIITIFLVGFLFLAAMIFPGQINARQVSSDPIPTSTPLPKNMIAESGNTEDLMWGAGIILFIIISGVVIQRVILNADPNTKED
jgi:hypothetical protein